MFDDKTEKGPADRDRVNVHENYELRYWFEKFNCTHEELKSGAGEAGIMARMSRLS